MKLGVNVDHVATLRQARGTRYPDPVIGALLAEYAGASSIVAHLREDRRHIRERDIALIKNVIHIPFNLEMSTYREIVAFACECRPHQATLVPERRRELTTEGGIDLIGNQKKVSRCIESLKKSGIKLSLFIDPVKEQIKAAEDLGVGIVELNTGRYSEAKTKSVRLTQLNKVRQAAGLAKRLGFFVAAGHGLDYANVKEIAAIAEIEELNIGHAIICRSVFVGMVAAVEEMISLINKPRKVSDHQCQMSKEILEIRK